jgi:hypothetical protein
MPVRRTLRRSPTSDIDAVRGAIRVGVHLLPTRAQQLDATRFLTDTQKSLLAHLCPSYKSAMRFLYHCQPDPAVLAAARAELKDDIERADSTF